MLTEAPCGSVAVMSRITVFGPYAAKPRMKTLSLAIAGVPPVKTTVSGTLRSFAVMVRVSPSGSLNMGAWRLPPEQIPPVNSPVLTSVPLGTVLESCAVFAVFTTQLFEEPSCIRVGALFVVDVELFVVPVPEADQGPPPTAFNACTCTR